MTLRSTTNVPDDHAATSEATTPLEPNAAVVHPVVLPDVSHELLTPKFVAGEISPEDLYRMIGEDPTRRIRKARALGAIENRGVFAIPIIVSLGQDAVLRVVYASLSSDRGLVILPDAPPEFRGISDQDLVLDILRAECR